jgi:hypothetical protein
MKKNNIIALSMFMVLSLFVNKKSISQIVIKAGTEIIASSRTEISPTYYNVGDKVSFNLIDSKYEGKATVLKFGSRLEGIITESKKANFFGKGGEIRFLINNLLLQNGKIELTYLSEKNQSSYEKGAKFTIKIEKDINLIPYPKKFSDFAKNLLNFYKKTDSYDYHFNTKNFIINELDTIKLNDTNFIVNQNNSKITGYNRGFLSEIESSIFFSDYLKHSEDFESFLKLYSPFYGINSSIYDNYKSGKFKYEYIDELGIFLVLEGDVNDYKWTSKLYFRAFDPVYGPLVFKNSNNNQGFKFLNKQEKLIRLEGLKNYSLMSFKNPEQYLNRYKLPDVFHVSPRDANYPDSSYEVSISNENGNISLFNMELPIYGRDNIEYSDTLDYYICRERTTIKNDKKEKYFPSYEEKEAVYKVGAITRIDLLNDNYYYYRSLPDETIFKYGILNKFGFPIIRTVCEEIRDIDNSNYYIIKYKNKYGLIQLNSNNLKSNKFQVYKNIFDEMIYKGKGLLTVKLDGAYFNIDFFGNIFYPIPIKK